MKTLNLKTAFIKVLIQGAGDNRDKAVIFTILVIPAVIAFAMFGHITKY